MKWGSCCYSFKGKREKERKHHITIADTSYTLSIQDISGKICYHIFDWVYYILSTAVQGYKLYKFDKIFVKYFIYLFLRLILSFLPSFPGNILETYRRVVDPRSSFSLFLFSFKVAFERRKVLSSWCMAKIVSILFSSAVETVEYTSPSFCSCEVP